MSVAVDVANSQSITQQATEAVRSAYEASLAKGLTVTIVEDDAAVEIHSDGSKQVTKRLAPLQEPTQRTIRIR